MNIGNINRIKSTNRSPYIRIALASKFVTTQLRFIKTLPDVGNLVNKSISLNNELIKNLQPVLSIISKYKSRAIANVPTNSEEEKEKDGTVMMDPDDYKILNDFMHKNPMFISGLRTTGDKNNSELFNYFPIKSDDSPKLYCYKEIEITKFNNIFENYNDLLNFANKSSQLCIASIYQDQTVALNTINEIMNSQHEAWKRALDR